MICVECDELVLSLHTEYKNGHIKLTDCQNCKKTADKYVEYDTVLLFIDILLLKPQAYKHLVYNLVNDDDSLAKMIKKVYRIRFLSILFEIYLNWAYKEKEFNVSSVKSPYLIYHVILEKSIPLQYAFFGLKCISDDISTHFLIHVLYLKWLNWLPKSYQLKKKISVEDINRLKIILSMTILISGGMKLFPILMLIWPYDNIAITTTIASISNINLIESLRIVTNYSWSISLTLFTITTVLKTLITKTILILILSKFNLATAQLFANQEYIRFISQIDTVKSYFIT